MVPEATYFGGGFPYYKVGPKQIITRVSYNSTSIVVKEPRLPTYNKAIYRGYNPTCN